MEAENTKKGNKKRTGKTLLGGKTLFLLFS